MEHFMKFVSLDLCREEHFLWEKLMCLNISRVFFKVPPFNRSQHLSAITFLYILTDNIITAPNYVADIDECKAGNPCKNGGTCVNTIGSYKCLCPKEFTGKFCGDGELLWQKCCLVAFYSHYAMSSKEKKKQSKQTHEQTEAERAETVESMKKNGVACWLSFGSISDSTPMFGWKGFG